jgi:hypothetical protein
MDEQPDPTREDNGPGEAPSGRLPYRGCLVFAAVIGLIVYGLYRYLISLGTAGSFSF